MTTRAALLLVASLAMASRLQAQAIPVVPSPIVPANPATNPVTPPPDEEFDWQPALNQSMRFLLLEHGVRLALQPGTRRQLRGPFLADYATSVRSVNGWGDGDNWIINYVNHPMQGAMAGYIQVQNDPKGRKLEFGDRGYWRSRLKALAWNTAYSTQFEIGPISESSIGNVSMRKGSQGVVDLVVTPVGGFAFMLAEDALDKWLVRKWESRTDGLKKRGFYRMAFNPCRTFANVLRGKRPWYRDGRPLWP